MRSKLTVWGTSSKGVFIPDNPKLAVIKVRLQRVGQTAVKQLPDKNLAQLFGGRIPVRAGKEQFICSSGQLLPSENDD